MYLRDVIESVDATHNGLGALVAMCQLAVVAHKAFLIVSPSGCGKSTAMSYVASFYQEVLKTDSTSRAGLGKHAEGLSNSQTLIVVDDLSTTQTFYARGSTLTALTALCYTHEIHSDMGGEGGTFSIDNFNGSALVGVQPTIFKEILILPEYEGTIRDKMIRYYHLRRPVTPDLKFPTVQLKFNKPIDTVQDFQPDKDNPEWKKILALGLMQFSRARAQQHGMDLLKACACLDDRTEVTMDDYELIEVLMRPMAFEVIAIDKQELEGERELNNNLLALLAEYYSYGGQYALAQVASDYQMTLQQCYRILKSQNGYWEETSKSPTIFKPSKTLLALLRKYKLEVL